MKQWHVLYTFSDNDSRELIKYYLWVCESKLWKSLKTPLITNHSSLRYDVSNKWNAVKRPVERVFAQNFELNKSLIIVYVRNSSKTLVIVSVESSPRSELVVQNLNFNLAHTCSGKHPLSNRWPKTWKQCCSSISKGLD